MTDTPITDAIAEGVPSYYEDCIPYTKAALAAAALTGPLVEGVTCPRCGGGGRRESNFHWNAYGESGVGVVTTLCQHCSGTGTVRLVVHVVTPEVAALAELFKAAACPAGLPHTGDDPASDHGHTDCWQLHAAAAVLDPQNGER